MAIYGKLFSIFERLEYINKDMKIDMGGKGSYDAISEREVAKIIRPMLKDQRIFVSCVSATVQSVVNGVTTIEYIYRLVDIDDEKSFIDVCTVGQGKSSADKGCGMASTYGFKYMWLRLFFLITGLDADNQSDNSHAAAGKKLEDDYIALTAELNDLQKGGFLKSVDNFTRIKAAVEATKGNANAIKQGMDAMKAVRAGTLNPDAVAP